MLTGPHLQEMNWPLLKAKTKVTRRPDIHALLVNCIKSVFLLFLFRYNQ